MRSKATQQNRFMRIISIPVKALCKARDLYVKSMMDCASGRSGYGGLSGMPQLPRSYSVASSRSEDSEDLRELIRASSTSGLGNISAADLEFYLRQIQLTRNSSTGSTNKFVPRSSSVGMGRIDEDQPCVAFGELPKAKANDTHLRTKLMMYPRSKSYAVPKPSVGF